MKNKIKIQVKAVVLLLVFSANSLLGFACSVGLNLGYNAQHHQRHHGIVHRHPLSVQHEKKDCCSHAVTAFNLLCKLKPTSVGLAHPGSLVAFPAPLLPLRLPPQPERTKNVRHFVQNDHPPIRDVRIAIQSFQI